MLCLIRSRILQNSFPESAWSWEFYRYISSEGFILSLQLNNTCICIDMFVHLITVYVLLCLFMLSNLTVGYTLSWYFVLYLTGAYVSPPLCHCYICVCINMFVNVIYMVLRYVCVLHKICSLAALHIGHYVKHISCILLVITFSPSSLTYIHKSGLTPCCLN